MQLPLALAQLHHNRQLFADRFLDVTLPQRAEWLALADESAAALAAVRAILAAYTPSANEAQTEKDLVHPVLNALGHTYEIQASLRTPKGTKKPDYVFYTDQAALTANKNRTLSAADLAAAFAVGDAKHWERKLDVSSTSDEDEINRVPADQIAFYMRHSGVAWGILTNGRHWRLYHRDSFERQDRYYEVDLPDLAEANDPLAFLYFYAFFRRAAFDPPAAHPLTLAALLRESADYARGVSDSLKEQVYDALRHIAQGFLDYPRNKLEQNPDTLQTIYANSLIVLYRLLFVLYAEARELLPLRESTDYREEYSLYAVVREAARRLDSGMSLLLDTGRTWAKLRDLFGIINVGSPPLNVATFNGGLFDPQRHPFLEQYTVGDAQLQQALNKLARVVHPQTGLKEFIDYRDLAERHLGTIYEGLLEYRLVELSPHQQTPSPQTPLPERERGFAQQNNAISSSPSSLPSQGERDQIERIVIPANLHTRMLEVARRFRKEPTPSEEMLWQALRNRQLEQRKFRRQQPIGPFVVDFYCSAERLIVEVDGPIHATRQEADAERQQLLEQAGYRMLRIPTALVEHDLPQALQNIRTAFTPSPVRLPSPPDGIPSPEPSPQTPLPERERGFQQHQGDKFAATPPSPLEGEGGWGDEGGSAGGEGESSLPRTPADAGFTVALVNDKGERHRTGSYYTPDFVVQYIVEQTLQPILDAAVASAGADDAAQIAAVLGVNVLDPAMGSGHFPVAAMEYIARYLVDLGVAPPAEAAGEPDLAYWKRRVAQSCIYGVDLNPLAVDLAKLSLWLATAAKGRPLSFLDHHLRCGNALVGARVSDLDNQPQATNRRRRAKPAVVSGPSSVVQTSLLDDAAFAGAMSSAVGSMWLIEDSAGASVADVKAQEQLYEQVRRSLTERFAVQANLRTAAAFGQAPEPALWQSLTDYAARRDTGAFAMPAYEPLLQQVRDIAAAQRFFHWDLEFPEVFFDRHGRPLGAGAGFDAVIGNPPYVRQEQLGPVKPYFQAAFAETYSGTADLFVYFFHQGVKLLQQDGRMGYIASNSWLRANYATPLRAFMREHLTVEQLIDLGDNRVFADAPDVYPAIPLVRKTPPPADHTAQAATFSRGEGLKQFDTQVAAKLAPVSIHDQQDSGWQLGADAGRRVFAKIANVGRSLREVVEGRIYRGVLTGLNEAFIIDQATHDQIVAADQGAADFLHPMLRGEDLRPWYQENENRWLIGLPYQWTRKHLNNGLTETEAWNLFQQRHPSIATHLAPFADAARKRGDKGEYWWELRPCDYYDAFNGAKIFYPELAKQPRFSWDETGAYVNNKGFIIPTDQLWLLGLLNSRAIWFVIMRTALGLGERAGMERFQLFAQYISKLPIPDAPPAAREAIGALAMEITAAARARYTLHQRARRRILSDLGVEGKQLNQKLTAWWDLEFSAFRDEIRKVFKREIAVKERDDWEEWLAEQRRRHAEHTAAIIAGETALNTHVYQLFELTADEIQLIEASTKYTYGEV